MRRLKIVPVIKAYLTTNNMQQLRRSMYVLDLPGLCLIEVAAPAIIDIDNPCNTTPTYSATFTIYIV